MHIYQNILKQCIKSNQLKLISSKPKCNITKTKTIQLVSYWVSEVSKKDTDTFPKKKKENNNMQQQIQATQVLCW